jgi:hypothetical protein
MKSPLFGVTLGCITFCRGKTGGGFAKTKREAAERSEKEYERKTVALNFIASANK